MSESTTEATEATTTMTTSSDGSDDQLGEIIELPSLEGTYDSPESTTELELLDPVVESWLFPPWMTSDGDFYGFNLDPTAGGECLTPSSFETLNWVS